MKNRFIIVYTVFATLVFIFSLSFFGYNLYNEYSHNYDKSEAKFNQLVTEVKFLSNQHTENTAEYAEAIKKSIGNPSGYAFLQLKRDNQTVLLYPDGKSKEETISKMSRTFENTFSINNKSIRLDCNYYLIHPDSIFYYARVSFLMILIITLITVIMIVYLSMTENKSEIEYVEEENPEIENESQAQTESEREAELESDSALEEAQISQEETIEEASSPAPEETTESESEKIDTPSQQEPVEEALEVENNNEVEAPKAEEISEIKNPEENKNKVSAAEIYDEPVVLPIDEVQPSEEDDIPSGLYNTETGIGWESYLLPRLNNEIDRATASEIDLSLFIIRLPDLHLDSEEYKNVCRYLTLQFQFRDLLFEYKENSIVAIKISMDVDAAITFAEKLYADIHNIVNNKSCFIGISSRSIRMVTGERLMLEADQAVEHAVNDPDSPIIAFRVDSNKYRQMMEQN